MANISSHDALGTTTTTDTTSFASRNPGKAVQQARGRKKGEPLSDGQKLDRKEKTAARKVRAEDLAADIEAFCAYRSNLVVSLAAKHDKQTEYIKTLLGSGSAFKSTHEVSLRNAVMHRIGKEEKIEPPDSDAEEYEDMDRATIKKRKRAAVLLELHRLTDEALKEGFTPEEEEEMKEVLRDYRALKRVGLRASNAAAAADARAIAAHVQDEFVTLMERTGTRCFAFLTRGHCDDATMSTFLHSGDASAFCIEVLKKAPLDIVRLFEQWACSRSSENVQRDTRNSLCAEIAKIIEEKLHLIIHNNTARIDYVNMDVAIREKWKVEISGWPADIDMVAPGKVKNIERLRRLREGWVSGRTCWVAMTPEQVAELAEKLAALRAKNGGVVKTRKARSDTGGKHAKAPRAVGKPRKTTKAAKAKTAGKKLSKRRVEEDEDDEEEDEDDEEEDEDDDEEEDDEDDEDDEPPARPHIPRASVSATPAASATGTAAAATAATGTSGSPNTPHDPSACDAAAPIVMSTSTTTTTTFIPYIPPAPFGDSTNKKRKADTDAGGATKKRKTPPKAKAAAPVRRPGSGYKAPKSAPGGAGARSDATTARIIQQMAERSALAYAAQLPPQ